MKIKVVLIALVIALALDALAHRPLKNYSKGESAKVFAWNCKDESWHPDVDTAWQKVPGIRCKDALVIPQTVDARQSNGR